MVILSADDWVCISVLFVFCNRIDLFYNSVLYNYKDISFYKDINRRPSMLLHHGLDKVKGS